jgi:hypothetical protein
MKLISKTMSVAIAGLALQITAHAQVLSTTGYVIPEGRSGVGAVFASSDVDMEVENNIDADIERKILGAIFEHGIADSMAIFAHIGLSTDVEIGRADGDGFTLGVGAKYRFYHEDRVKIIGYGAFNRFDDDVEYLNIESEVTLNELHMGGVGVYEINPSVEAYGGLEIVPYSNGEVDSEGSAIDYDIERDDLVSLKLGANVYVKGFVLRPEFTLLSEQTLALSALYLF